MEERFQKYERRGLQIFGIFTDGPTGGAPTPEDLDGWRQEYGLSFDIIALSQPQATAIFKGTYNTPAEALVRGDTMEIVGLGNITDAAIEQILP